MKFASLRYIELLALKSLCVCTNSKFLFKPLSRAPEEKLSANTRLLSLPVVNVLNVVTLGKGFQCSNCEFSAGGYFRRCSSVD